MKSKEKSLNKVIELVTKISELDKVVDFSRAHIQLEIILCLMSAKCLTVDEIINKLKIPKRSIIDAARKLEMKGIVSRLADKLCLTDTGKRFIVNLLSIIGIKNVDSKGLRSSCDGIVTTLCNSLALDEYLYLTSIVHRILLELYSSSNGVDEKRLSRILKLSSYRLREYIEYINKLYNNPITYSIKNGKRIYKLNDHGFRLCKNIVPPYTINLNFLRKIKLAINILTFPKKLTLLNTCLMSLATISLALDLLYTAIILIITLIINIFFLLLLH